MQGLNFCCGLSCHYRHCVVFARTAGMLSIELDWADIPCHQIRLGFHRRQRMSVISRTNTHRRRVFPSAVTSDVGVAQEMLDSLRAACEQCRNAGTILLVQVYAFFATTFNTPTMHLRFVLLALNVSTLQNNKTGKNFFSQTLLGGPPCVFFVRKMTLRNQGMNPRDIMLVVPIWYSYYLDSISKKGDDDHIQHKQVTETPRWCFFLMFIYPTTLQVSLGKMVHLQVLERLLLWK